MTRRIIPFVVAIVFWLTGYTSFAVDEHSSTTAMQMKPLTEKLANLTQTEISAGYSRYSDTAAHWGKAYIGKLTQLGIVSGSGGKFRPDGDMSIAEFLKISVLSLGYKIPDGTKVWYQPYVAQALKDRIIDQGEYKDYLRAITREEAAKIMYRAATLFKPAVENQGYLVIMRSRMLDYAKTSDNKKDYFIKSLVMGYFSLDGKGLGNPQGRLTRAQACTVIIRLLDENELQKFEVQDGETFVGSDGKTYYPQYSVDPVKAINVMEKSKLKDKGYVDTIVVGILGANYTLYESEEEFKTLAVTGMDICIDIKMGDNARNSNDQCEIVLFDEDAIESKHMDIITDLFKYYFESKSSEALKEFDAMLHHGIKDKEIKINDRYLSLFNNTVVITCKGGLNSQQYINKYMKN